MFRDRAVGGVEDPRRQWQSREGGDGAQHGDALGDFDGRVGADPPAALLIHGMQRIDKLGERRRPGQEAVWSGVSRS